MDYLYIILIGYVFNFFIVIVSTILILIISTISIMNDPKQMIGIKRIEYLTEDFNQISKSIPFFKQSPERVAFVFPFASIIGVYILISKISKNKGLIGYLESEIRNLNKIKEDMSNDSE